MKTIARRYIPSLLSSSGLGKKGCQTHNYCNVTTVPLPKKDVKQIVMSQLLLFQKRCQANCNVTTVTHIVIH